MKSLPVAGLEAQKAARVAFTHDNPSSKLAHHSPKNDMLRTCLILGAISPAFAINAYGHAYSRPLDFSPQQYQEIASRFSVFTVEKAHAASVYGNASALPPFKTNSIASTIGTARKIKAINASVKVLMYWNAALHFNFYECESQVQPSWVMPSPPGSRMKVPFYNYSVPEFREWWVKCAVDAISNSSGALSGLFLDATPKVAEQDHNTELYAQHLLSNNMDNWGSMVDQIRKALGPDAIIIDNGFFRTGSGQKLAGDDAWSHTTCSYTESMSGVGTPSYSSPANGMALLLWVANASQAHPYPNRVLIGHGGMEDTTAFMFGLAKYLLVTSTVANGWFLANDGYGITDGILDQPMRVYEQGVGCGEPTEMVRVVGEYVLRRAFEFGNVTVDVGKGTATIDCSGQK